MKGKITVDGKVFQKTLRFGNQAYKTVFKNHIKYSRKDKWSITYNE
jgi:hypothetical protein